MQRVNYDNVFGKKKIQEHWAALRAKGNDSALCAEVNGPYWSQEFFKARGENFFFNIEDHTAGVVGK